MMGPMRTMATLSICAVLSIALTGKAADDVAAARAHYERGKRAYDLGHFAEAAREYELAYQAKDDSALLFNLGQAHRLAGDYAQALLAYKAFLRNVPDAPNRTEVDARIRETEILLEHQQRLAPSAPATAPATNAVATKLSSPAPIYKRWWFWSVVGVVVAGGAVGLGVGLTRASPSYGSAAVSDGTFRF